MERTRIILFSLVLALALMCAAPCAVFAADSGACGRNLTWTLTDDGVLTISGTGSMWGDGEWDRSRVKIVRVGDGVTSIGFNSFEDAVNLVGVVIPDSVTHIGSYAFDGCSRLNVFYSGSEADWVAVEIEEYNEKLRCAEMTYDYVPASALSLKETSLTLGIGERKELRLTASPAGASAAALWRSGDSSVVSVENGRLIAVGAGSAVVTALSPSGSALARCSVTVRSSYGGGAEVASPFALKFPTGLTYDVYSRGRGWYRAGVSTASQFIDERGNFCFALDRDDEIILYKTSYGKITKKITVPNRHELFGGACCDGDGYFYLVFGDSNDTENDEVNTIFAVKYSPEGKELASVGSARGAKIPFTAGNCAMAVSGGVLAVDFGRLMYNGHQSNSVWGIETETMTSLDDWVYDYNSHSFDQRVTPYAKTGGFLFASQGDCFPRAFTVAVSDGAERLNKLETFHFWVEPGTWDDYDMTRLNVTRSRLGNVLATDFGAALVGASARSLSAAAATEPYDVFIQVFDPLGSEADDGTYLTKGGRSGLGGNNGDTAVADRGVKWLTDLAGSGKTVGEVQAVAVDDETIVILYELYDAKSEEFDSSRYMAADSCGHVVKEGSLGRVRLNTDEDPVYANGAVQWVANAADGRVEDTERLELHSLYLDFLRDEGQPAEMTWRKNGLTDVKAGAYYADAVYWALENGVTEGTSLQSFSPNAVCTRGQVVTFLWRARGCPEPETAENPFKDVKSGAYYYKAVLWAVEQGITKGTSAAAFSPNEGCSRGQVVTFLHRLAGEPAANGANPFQDVKKANYFYNAVLWAAAEGVTAGTDAAHFSPNETCKRGQIVTFLYRYLAE